MVVILAAGKGSRMGLEEGVSKCAVPCVGTPEESTVSRLLRQFKEEGHEDFVIVTGYGAESVYKNTKIPKGARVHWVHNPRYADFGCCYSTALGVTVAVGLMRSHKDEEVSKDYAPYNSLIIVEGDTVTSYRNLMDFHHGGLSPLSRVSEVLCRESSFLSNKSVAVLTDEGSRVRRFLYDQNHKFDFTQIAHIDKFYDSCQMWKFTYEDALLLSKVSQEYKMKVEIQNFGPENGVYLFNQILSKIEVKPLLCSESKSWFNLNTRDDLNNIKKLSFLGRLEVAGVSEDDTNDVVEEE